MSSRLSVILAAGVLAGMAASASAQDQPRFGKPISEADIAPWNIDIRTPDGKGLPPGSGNVADGEKIYNVKCLACHGPKAAGGAVYGTMVGGIGSFKTEKRVLTPGSMYPYAPILYDYINRAMPMDKPQTLTPNEVYALSAYILNLNGLIPAEAVMDANTLPKVKMPNAGNFYVDDRPDTKAVRCMSNCR
jgi:mono/diheme cytochrome c family protein